MKKITLLMVSLLFTQVYAQKLGIDLKESKVYKMTTPRVQNDYILPDNEGGFITISTKRTGFLANPLVFESYATHYNAQMEQIKTKTFKLNKGIVKGNIKGAFIKEGHMYLLNLESNLRKRYYSFKIIDANIATREISEKEIFHIDKVYPKTETNLFVNLNSLYYEKLKYYSDVNYFNPKIIIKFSKNNNYFTIIHRDFNELQTKYFVDVFDSNFNKVFSRFFSYPAHSKLLYINDVDVNDDNGDVYVATKLYNSDPLYKRRFVNTSNIDKFIVYRLSKLGYKKHELKPKKVIESLHFAPGDDLTIIGFYRNSFLDVNDTDGLMLMRLNKQSMELNHIAYTGFKEKLVSVKYKTRRKRSKNHEMIIRKVFKTKNGDLIINSEDFFIPLMNKKFNREETISEIVGDLFSIRLNKSGGIVWTKKIFKYQRVKPRLALHSCFATLINDTDYLLFTDSKIKKTSNKEAFYLQGKDLQNLNGVRLTYSGNLQEGVVKENRRTKYRLMPIEGTMISPNEAIIPAKDHQFIKFYKLTFR